MSDWDVIGLVEAPADSGEEDFDEDNIILENKFTDSILSGSVGLADSPHHSQSPSSQTDHPAGQYDQQDGFGGISGKGKTRKTTASEAISAEDATLSAEQRALAILNRNQTHSYTPHALQEMIKEEKESSSPSSTDKSPKERRKERKRRSSMNRGRDKRNIVSVSGEAGSHRFDHISHELLQPGKFVQAKYDKFHAIAIGERAASGIGLSAEMNSLYYFWCYYLRDNFNEEMYKEFLSFAKADIQADSHYGIECYFRMCSYGLEKRWDEKVYKDFENEALEDYKRGSKYGLGKVKGFLDNQKIGIEIPVSPEMKQLLNQFPTFESFDGSDLPQPHRFVGKKFRPGFAPVGQSVPKPSAMLDSAPPKNQRNRPERNQRSGEERNDRKPPTPSQQGKKPKPFANAKRGRRHYNEPGEMSWSFGTKVQPSSAPNDSPMRKW